MKLWYFSIIDLSLMDCRKDACMVVFLSGCNMRCIYCQNYPDLLKRMEIGVEELVQMAKNNWAIGCVKFSGGEPTLQREGLLEACRRLNDESIGVGIDTNGTAPQVIEELAKIGLFEASVDFKAPRSKYIDVTGLDAYDLVIDTIEILNDYNVDYEVRTTVALPMLTEDDLMNMANELRRLDVPLWTIQSFIPTNYTPRRLRTPETKWLEEVANRVREEYGLCLLYTSPSPRD